MHGKNNEQKKQKMKLSMNKSEIIKLKFELEFV